MLVPRRGTKSLAVGETYGETKEIPTPQGSNLWKIPFINFDAGVAKQLSVFLFERHLTVMVLLTLDVGDKFRLFVKRMREGSISFLPNYKVGKDMVLFDPE